VQYFEGGDGGRVSEVKVQCTVDRRQSSTATVAALELLTVEEDPPLHYNLTVGVHNPPLCSLLSSPEAILAPLNHTCIDFGTGGWWSYRVCLGLNIVQYHGEGGTRLQETILGNYDWVHGERLLAGGDMQGNEEGSKEEAVDLLAIMKSSATIPTPSLSQQYTHGAPCDVRGGHPRSSLVRFQCTPLGDSSYSQTISFLGVEESPTCFYTITLGSSLACSHPLVGFAHSVAPPPVVHDIVCQPEGTLPTT